MNFKIRKETMFNIIAHNQINVKRYVVQHIPKLATPMHGMDGANGTA